jgi:putative hemolysin
MPQEIVVFVLCLLMSGFFSGSETAFLSAGRIRLGRLASEGDAAARSVLDLVQDPRRLLAGILVGNNLVNILAAVVAGVFCTDLMGGEAGAGAFLATAVATPLVVLVGEFLPKTFAALHPVPYARAAVRPIRACLFLLTPVVFFLEAITRPLGAMLRHRKEGFGIAELRVAVGEGVRHGVVDETMARVLRGGLSLYSKTVGDILVPRVDIEGVEAGAGHEQCLDAFRRHNYSRLLVMEGTPDHDVGYLAAKDLTRLKPGERQGWTARKGARQAVRVPASMPLPRLLAKMRRSGVHFAVVKDEYGGTEGIATLEDVLEELVGEIRDEHDEEELPPFQEAGEHTWLVRGDVSMKELNDRLETAIEAEESRTVA